jgi:hypothetical protein
VCGGAQPGASQLPGGASHVDSGGSKDVARRLPVARSDWWGTTWSLTAARCEWWGTSVSRRLAAARRERWGTAWSLAAARR